jgi:hypothetical protein
VHAYTCCYTLQGVASQLSSDVVAGDKAIAEVWAAAACGSSSSSSSSSGNVQSLQQPQRVQREHCHSITDDDYTDGDAGDDVYGQVLCSNVLTIQQAVMKAALVSCV